MGQFSIVLIGLYCSSYSQLYATNYQYIPIKTEGKSLELTTVNSTEGGHLIPLQYIACRNLQKKNNNNKKLVSFIFPVLGIN